MKAEIDIKGIRSSIVLDGTDVSNGVRALTLRSAAGELTKLELEMCTTDGATITAGTALVAIADATANALITMGWLPPGGHRCPECDKPVTSVVFDEIDTTKPGDTYVTRKQGDAHYHPCGCTVAAKAEDASPALPR
jgi:hypothetical protein